MGGRVQNLFEEVSKLETVEDLGALIELIRGVFNVENVAYIAFSLGHSYTVRSTAGAGLLKGTSGSWWRAHGSLTAATYKREWGDRYAEAEYHRIDPVVEGALTSFVPMDWKQLRWDSKKRRQMFIEAIDAGLGAQGYTVPVRGPNGQFAIFVVNQNCSDKEWAQFIKENAGDLLIVAHFFHQKVLEIERVFGPPSTPQLSAREQDALRYIASGRSRAQVAYDMKISENTLRVYLDSARHKLGALNVTHAVAIGMNRGIVTI